MITEVSVASRHHGFFRATQEENRFCLVVVIQKCAGITQGRVLDHFLDVVIQKCLASLTLLACSDQPLLVVEEFLSFFVLDLDLAIVNGVGCLDVHGAALGRMLCHKRIRSFCWMA